MNSIYITTAIPYVNAKPHIGFALELVLADALARSYRLQGDTVRLCTGSDENSAKNVIAAGDANRPIVQFVAEHAEAFRRLSPALGIAIDDFVRTSVDPRHLPAVHALWNACTSAGDIYRGTYEGWYCAGCEAFLSAQELVQGGCAEHPDGVQAVREDNHFFRLSRYSEQLRALIESDRLRIRPAHRRNEMLALLDAGLQDFSVSRPAVRSQGWGIPVPDDDKQVIYVWFDALVNYLAGLGYPDDTPLFRAFWQSGRVIHVIGKGISRFHALYWPAMLLSAGLRVPDDLWIHGYATVNGMKISKSAGTALHPDDAVNALHLDASARAGLGVDALRHFLLLHIGSDHDGDYSHAALAAAYQHELADTIGNLFARVLAMVRRYRNGNVPWPSPNPSVDDLQLRHRSAVLANEVASALQQTSSQAPVQRVLDLARALNAFVSAMAPWKLARAEGKRSELDDCLYTLICGLRAIAAAIAPLLPETAAAMQRQLTFERDAVSVLFPKPLTQAE